MHRGPPASRRHRPLEIAAIGVVGLFILVGVAAAGLFSKGAPAAALGAPRFVDETAAAGVDHIYSGGFEFAVGGGVALLDSNGDGKPQLYLAGGSQSAALYRKDSPVGGAPRVPPLRHPPAGPHTRNRPQPAPLD